MRKKGQINTLMSLFLLLVSLSSSFYLVMNFFIISIVQALILSCLICSWSTLLTSFKSGHFFGFKLDKKMLSKAITYLLVLTFFILYQLFMGWENIVFAGTPTTTVFAGTPVTTETTSTTTTTTSTTTTTTSTTTTTTSTTTTLPVDFDAWAEGSGTVTIAEPKITNIYVKNLKTEEGSYDVSYEKEAYDADMNRVDHLINVHMPSNRILSVEPDRVGSTSAAIVTLGPFARGTVTFNVTSESDLTEYELVKINVKPGYGLNLPEFDTIHIIQIFIIACLLLAILHRRPH